jgi:hypothetical protein
VFRASISTNVSSCAPSQTLAFPAIPQATTDGAAVSQLRKMTQLPQMHQNPATKAPVFLVVDNVDQLESQDDEAIIFSESIALAHKNSLNLILSLRDATFVKHRSSPTFDAYDFATIAIDAPAIPAVLSRRFFLMKQLLAGRSGNFIAENGARVEVADLSVISDLVSSNGPQHPK